MMHNNYRISMNFMVHFFNSCRPLDILHGVIHGDMIISRCLQVPNVNHPKIEATRYRVVYKKVISRSTLQTCVVDDEI